MNNLQRLKVFGIGSPFGDDRIGWVVVEMLKQKSELIPYISKSLYLENLDRPCVELLDSMRGTKIVILIDAIKSGSPLGTIHQYENPQFENNLNLFSTHSMGVMQTLQLGAALNDLPEQLFLYGIEIGHINYGEIVSGSIYAAASSLAETITSKILNLLI